MCKTKIFLILFFISLPLMGFGCKLGGDGPSAAPITLNYWRPWDGREDFKEIIQKYNTIHPNVKINYSKKDYNGFEQQLLEAWVDDKGPDIFSIHNTWMKKYQAKNFIRSLPKTTTMEYNVMKGSVKKELHIEERTIKSMTLKELEEDFIDAVYSDVVIKSKDEDSGLMMEKIYGMPLFVDSMVMFYNKDLFNNAGIIKPPKYWAERFQQDVRRLTKQNNKGEIVQSGVALGGAKNIYRSTDILVLLMMQNGTEIMNNNGDVLITDIPLSLKRIGRTTAPGIEALRFYTDFSNISKEVYCWNSGLNDSMDLFAEGKLAMMFGYAYMIPQIKAKNEKLQFGIAPMPQIEENSKIDIGNYWVEVVANKIDKNKIDAAWDFIQFITKAEQAELYLKKARKPTALKSLIDKQIDDQELGVFADQALTVKSWYRGVDSVVAESIMVNMIKDAGDFENSIQEVLSIGASKLQQTSRLK